MSKLITDVVENSPAHLAGIKEGDLLLSLNGAAVQDVFDYRSFARYELVTVKVRRGNAVHKFRVGKDEDEDLGLVFAMGLMDDVRSCENNCVFCFADQNPPGTRSSLLFKDDDWRMSFLTGSYITLTNMSRRDFKRLIKYRLSPVNISVHASSPDVRKKLMRNKRAGMLFRQLEKLRRAGIEFNLQIVLCKGINDGEELVKTVDKLAMFAAAAQSLSVVPVGLTKHRNGLHPLAPFSREEAAEVVRLVESLAEGFKDNRGTSFVWAADEFYVKGGLPLPEYEYYENFSQLANGVGVMALFEREFDEELERNPGKAASGSYHIATGLAAGSYMEKILNKLCEMFPRLDADVIAIRNNFFGDMVTVSGLVTGRDIVSALKGKTKANSRLLIPRNMLRDGDDVFLDDMTINELERTLGIPVLAVPVNGAEFVKVFTESKKAKQSRDNLTT